MTNGVKRTLLKIELNSVQKQSSILHDSRTEMTMMVLH
jgi:hypothetical protein